MCILIQSKLQSDIKPCMKSNIFEQKDVAVGIKHAKILHTFTFRLFRMEKRWRTIQLEENDACTIQQRDLAYASCIAVL